MRRILFISLGLILVNFHITARVISVDNQQELNNAIANVQAGDTIVVRSDKSPYSDLEIVINANGTESMPIVIIAEKTGEVVLTGNSVVKIGGNYIYFEGFTFGGDKAPDNLIGNSIIEFRSSTSTSDWCYNCKIKDIEFDGHNQSDYLEEEKLKWVRVYGQDNEIVNCTFNKKKGVGNCITVERSDSFENRTLIHHNFFANRVPVMSGSSVLNDQDAIRIGYSGTSLSDAKCEVYNNFFYNWDGEPEIISNKSGRNKYYNNTFTKCVGTITLRHGTHCDVYGNFFFGENISKSGGVRVIDSDHKIYNNYFQDLNTGGSKVVGAINLFKGDDDYVSGGDLSSYAICENILVAHNTIVTSDKGIWIGPDDSGREYEPRDLEIVNNILIDCNDAALVGSAPSGTNIIKGNIKKGGTWWSGFQTTDNTETSNELTIADSQFERITNSSEAIAYAVPLSAFSINNDILGGSRDGNPDSGAEEYGAGGTFAPYTIDDVGISVGVVRSTATNIRHLTYDTENNISVYSNPANDKLIVSRLNADPVDVNIYNAAGLLVKSSKLANGQNSTIDISELNPGLYILKIPENKTEYYASKFLKK